MNLYENLPKNITAAPFTNSQIGMYLDCLQRPKSTGCNIAFCMDFPKKHVTAEVLQKAVNTMLKNHPMLFGRIVEMEKGVGLQLEPAYDICTIHTVPEAEIPMKKSQFIRPFDFSKDILSRAEIWESEETLHLMFEMHHLILDDSSLVVIMNELTALLKGESIAPESINPLLLYEVQEREKNTEAYQNAKAFFENLLAGIEVDSVPIPDHVEELELEKFPKEITTLHLTDSEIIEKIQKIVVEKKLTESSIFMTAFSYALAKFTGQTESLLAVATSGRGDQRLKNCVSMLVKMLPVYCNFDESGTPISYIEKTQKTVSASIKHSIYPFSEIVEEFSLMPEVLFAYQEETLSGVAVGDTIVPIEFLHTDDAMAKISCHISKNESAYEIRLEYRDDIYTNETIERLGKIYLSVLSGFADNAVLKEIDLISAEDIALHDTWNDTKLDYDSTKTFIDMFRESVEQFPDKVAVVFKDKKITYKELDELTDKVAEYVTGQNLQVGDVVSILIERNEFMPICAFGVLKAGFAYQPLDPTYPPDRLAFMMEDAKTKLLIAQKELLSIVPDYKGTVLHTAEIHDLPKKSSTFRIAKPDETFILLYTSGSTGVPKGCQLMHRNLIAFLNSHYKIVELDSDSIMTGYASFGFDASIVDIFAPLGIGAALHIIPSEMRLNLEELLAYYKKHKLTHAFMTTQVARQFAPLTAEMPDLKYLFTGGEALAGVKSEGTTKLMNIYGPTETTVYVTSLHVDQLYRNIPIGKALPNVKLYIVDPHGRRLPVGVPGELLIASPQVSKGYLGREEQTKKVFTPNTHCAEVGYETLYHTGDIVRYLADGNIEFVGRRDSQVKINGYRIELTEVETVIKDYPSIKDVTVLAKSTPDGAKMLHAYIVSDEKVDINALNAFILETKPPYIVPSATMQIDEIPLNQNFKVDKRKLPEIVVEAEEEDTTKELTRIEKELKTLVGDVVGHEKFGLSTPLGLVGLTSISSMKLAGNLVKVYGTSPDVVQLAKNHSILSLESFIIDYLLENVSTGNKKETASTDTEQKQGYSLTQSQLGIYLDSQTPEGMATYNIPILVQLPKNIELDKFKSAIHSAISAHPSMLCNIKANADGDPEMLPRSDMEIVIAEKEWNGNLDEIEQTEFAFSDAPLFAVTILQSKMEQFLLFELHHIIGDGESVMLLLADIQKAYSGESVEKEAYTTFFLSDEEEKNRKTDAYTKAKAYYDGVFQGVSVDVLPKGDVIDAPSSVQKMSTEIPIKDSKIVAFCQENNVTENAFFTSALGIFLGKFSASDEALFNVIHNGRTDARSLGTVGMFVKTMPVYCNLSETTLLSDFFVDVEEHLTALKEHGIYSYSKVSRAYNLQNNILFAYQGEMLSHMDFCGEPLVTTELPQKGNKAPMNIDIFKKETVFSVAFDYDSGRFSNGFMESFIEAFVTCIENCASAKTIGDVTILTPEKEESLKLLHDTLVEVKYRPVYRLLQDSAEKSPNHLAVVANKEKLTYQELNEQANIIGHQLQNIGVGVNDIVALMLDRTKYVYIARQGILKSGAAFLSIDPTYPEDRVEFMLSDAKVNVLLITRDIYEEQKTFLSTLQVTFIFLDEIGTAFNASDLNVDVPEDALAYCIYTSGSTGKPKGVMLTQRNLVNFVDNNPKNHEILGYIEKGSVSLALASITFDVSIMEEFIPLAHGLTICMATIEEIHNPFALRDLCIENKVDIMTCTPSFLSNMVDMPEMKACLAGLKSADLGAEAFPAALLGSLRAVNPDLYIMNGYGPTEATVSCTMGVITQDKQITIGIPNSNVKVVIVDEKNRILPIGALGEMVILGDGVGKGYVNRPDLTEKVFTKIWGMNAYKSGDFARLLPNGEIEFRGRVDNQVKLRGFRVELGEIETNINKFDGVKTSMVLKKESTGGEYLVGYFTAETEIDQTALVAHLSATLTAYMVPSVWVQMDAFPLTANGKINKAALPDQIILSNKQIMSHQKLKLKSNYVERLRKF